MVDDELFSIGEVARASGLSLSALRFYDRSGVLVPAEVAADTGYRWYSRTQMEAARLVARLRRVGLPLADVSTVLAHRDPEVTDRILVDHLRRLEDGLDAARLEVQRIRQWRPGDARREEVTTVVTGHDLVGALRSVRYAVGDDPQWPGLRGVLIESVTSAIRVVASDRFRAAFHEIPASASAHVREVMPVDFVDRLIGRVSTSDRVELRVGDGRVHAHFGTTVEESPLLDADFPDLSHVVPQSASGAVVDREELLAGLRAVPEAHTWTLDVAPGGRVDLSPERGADGDHHVVLDAEFLTQAVQTSAPGQLQFDLTGPIGPLAIRNVDAPGSFSIIMPIRPE